MGSEITYTHLYAYTYKIDITLYRDCDGKKLNGQGGGSSTGSSTDLAQAYIRTISESCQNKNIGNGITLTKIGFENITKICNPNQSKCGSNPTYPYGIEAHRYSGTIDFSTLLEYQGCAFQVFISKSERADANLLATSGDDIYNYAYIDPWKERTSSPTFSTIPSFVYSINQPAYGTEHVHALPEDSIVYKWASPMRAYNNAMLYQEGYSAQNYISTYCPGGGNCNPDPTVYPPQGIYLNPTTGDYILTPTQNNQTSYRVIEIEQWRKANGTPYLASKIRRDISIKTSSTIENNAPQINANSTYNLCIGQPFSLPITASDLAANGVSESGDSVFFSVGGTIAGLSVERKSSTTMPYNYLEIYYTPTAQDVGTHFLQIGAKDNFCPKYAESFKTIQLNVLPKAEVNLEIEEVFCGNNRITFNSNRTSIFDLSIYNEGSLIQNSLGIQSPMMFSNKLTQLQKYQLRYTDVFGCTDTLETIHNNKGLLGINKARLQGKTALCEGSSISASLTHNTYPISNISWTYLDVENTQDTFGSIAQNAMLKYNYTLTSNNTECALVDSTRIIVREGPSISVESSLEICFAPIINLDEINTLPNTGYWEYTGQTIDTKFDIRSIVPNSETSLLLTYNVRDEATSCISSEEVNINILKAPQLKLQDQHICGTNSVFKLRNGVELPFHLAGQEIAWRPLNYPNAFISTPEPTIDIPSYAPRTYLVEATNSIAGKCLIKDTMTIVVSDNLVLAVNENRTLCQSAEPLDLNKHFQINASGGVWESNINSLSFSSNYEYMPTECGGNTLRYTYDRNNCYDQIEFPIEIICKPNLSVAIPSEICIDYTELKLDDKYTWKGNGINKNILYPSLLHPGNHRALLTKVVDGCTFDSSIAYTIMPALNYSYLTNVDKLCEGESLELTLSSSYDFEIELATCADTLITSSNGRYSYQPTQCDLANGAIAIALASQTTALCPSHLENIEVPYFAKPNALLASAIEGCEPLDINTTFTVLAGADLAYQYTLQSEYHTIIGLGQNIEHNRLPFGKYSLSASISDKNGCKNEVAQKNIVVVNPTPNAEFTMSNKDRLALSERELILNNYSSLSQGLLNSKWYYTKNGKSTLFSNGNNPIYKLPADTGSFDIVLVASTEKGCSDTFSSRVVLVPDILAFIPNAFTPDNKGPESNATFSIISDHAQAFHIKIYNKWGQQVFESSDINHSWDGTFLGKYCQNGVYVYAIELINKTGVEYSYQGTVNLIR